MALTYTPAPSLGASCPEFTLPAVDGQTLSLDSFTDSKALVVMFICNHCPYVKAIEERLLKLGRELQPRGAQFVAICSNDAERYPEDSFENLKKRWQEQDYPFPYLYDSDQKVAKRFGAVCTPDFFVYDENRHLVYRGRLDDSWKDETAVRKEELKEAVERVLDGQPVAEKQTPSMGCSIKWLEN